MSEYSVKEECIRCIRVKLQEIVLSGKAYEGKVWFDKMQEAVENIIKIKVEEKVV